jgi:hypothetical protein
MRSDEPVVLERYVPVLVRRDRVIVTYSVSQATNVVDLRFDRTT